MKSKVAELVAFHYREAAALASASSAGDADTAAIRRNAVRWLVRAADSAQALTATQVPWPERIHVDPKSVVVLNADKLVPFEMVVAAMNESRKADISRFTFATARQ